MTAGTLTAIDCIFRDRCVPPKQYTVTSQEYTVPSDNLRTVSVSHTLGALRKLVSYGLAVRCVHSTVHSTEHYSTEHSTVPSATVLPSASAVEFQSTEAWSRLNFANLQDWMRGAAVALSQLRAEIWRSAYVFSLLMCRLRCS